MNPSRPSDQSLLDRLNALKSIGVTLDKPANMYLIREAHRAKTRARSTAILPVPDAQPNSKEDVLSARLRILRSQSSSSSRDGASTGAPPPGGPMPKEEGIRQVQSSIPGGAKDHAQKRPPIRSVEFEAADEEALDELLGALGDEEFDLAADEDAMPHPDLDPRDEAKRVSDLLESLGKDAGGPASNGPSNTEGDDDADNSDGEQMTRDVDTLLSQIRDEINSLPPPSATAPQDDEEAPFTLPTVPSQLVDPAPGPHGGEDALEQDLAARMASLRGLGLGPLTSTLASSASDPLGLPSAPTFRPQDRAGAGNTEQQQRLGGSSKYTDADQKTWCVVCLDDATVVCAGCDGDGYCARCWREMHTGPSAGYEERGHQWTRFERSPRS